MLIIKILIMLCATTSVYGSTLICSQPINLSPTSSLTGSPMFGCPTLAINNRDEAAAMWVIEKDKHQRVQISRQNSDGTWSIDMFSSWVKGIRENTRHNLGFEKFQSQLAIDDSGKIFACWWEDSDEPGLRRLERSIMDAHAQIWDLSISGAVVEAAAVWKHNDVFLLATAEKYSQNDCPLFSVKVNNQEARFSHLAQVSFNTELGVWPTLKLAVIDEQRVFAVFWDAEHNLRCSFYLDDNWTQQEFVCKPERVPLFLKPAFCKEHGGVCWYTLRGYQYIVEVVTYKNGVWSPIRQLSMNGEAARDPNIAVDDEGNILVVWESGKGDHSRVAAALKLAAQDDFILLQPFDQEGSNERPLVAVDHKGNFLIVWEKNDIGEIHGILLDSKQSRWSSSVCLSPKGNSCFLPAIIFGKNSIGIVAWQHATGRGVINEVAELRIID